MQLSSKKRNTIFWVLQLAGWGFLNIISVFVLKKQSFEFLLYSIVAGTIMGIFSTSLLRYYLKRNVSFENFGTKEIIKIVISYLVTSAIYGSLNIVFGFLYVKFGPALTDDDLGFLKNFDKVGIVIFNALFIIFVWLACYLIIKLLLKFNADRIERLELNSTLKQAQLNTLKGQINPHFMFNSLNNIRGLMLEDVEKSRDMLTKLSEMLRYSLTKNDVNAIALEEELEMVDNYIDLSKIQFEKRLKYVKEIDPKSLLIPIPPMIIQLLIENAAKHGISNLKAGGVITLKTETNQKELLIQVRNTGSLQLEKDSTLLGLKNIRQRLHLLYGKEASFSLEEIDDEVIANIKIPLL